MRLKVNLSAQYDLDLIALKENGYLLSKIMVNALVAYANEEFYIVNILPCITSNIKSTSVNITISDSKVIELMSQIKAGYKTAFIKAVTRASLSSPLIDCYFDNVRLGNIINSKKKGKPLKSQILKREDNVVEAKDQDKNYDCVNSTNIKKEVTHSSITNKPVSQDLKQSISPNDIMAAFDNL